jgi:hypothetical protein
MVMDGHLESNPMALPELITAGQAPPYAIDVLVMYQSAASRPAVSTIATNPTSIDGINIVFLPFDLNACDAPFSDGPSLFEALSPCGFPYGSIS